MIHMSNLLLIDEELAKLYDTDPIFRKSVEYMYGQNKSTIEILIFALKNGYRAKDDILKSYIEYAKTDCRPIIINGEKYNIVKEKL